MFTLSFLHVVVSARYAKVSITVYASRQESVVGDLLKIGVFWVARHNMYQWINTCISGVLECGIQSKCLFREIHNWVVKTNRKHFVNSCSNQIQCFGESKRYVLDVVSKRCQILMRFYKRASRNRFIF